MNYAKKTAVLIMLSLSAALVAGPAYADRHDKGHDNRRGNDHHDRWEHRDLVYDNRFHHDHYYPKPGFAVSLLPPDSLSISFGRGHLFFHSGVWYRPSGPRYVVVRPPVGVIIPSLPIGYSTVWANGIPYYYANDSYYTANSGGYVVAAPPANYVEVPPAAPASVPPPPVTQTTNSASWYYCESSRAYYPYVGSCREGWRQVPAAR